MRRSLCKVRIWGVLGLLLALMLAVGYGQVPQPPLPLPGPTLTIPPGSAIGDVLTAVNPAVEREEEWRFAELRLEFSATGAKEFTGRVVAFNLEPFETMDPLRKAISADMILAQETFSNVRPRVSLFVKSVRPVPVGILVLAERSNGISYSLAATPIKPTGPSFTPILFADNVSVGVLVDGITYTFQVRGEEEPLVLLKGEIREVCKGSVRCFNRSYWKLKYAEFRECRRRTDPGFVRYGYIITEHPSSDPWCFLSRVGWDSPYDPTDLTVYIKIGQPPRHYCRYDYVVLERKP